MVSKEGVQVDPSKIKAIMNWPRPANIKQLRGFLGLTEYYRSFVAQYAQLAFPLIELLKKNGFEWGVEAESAFEELKIAMMQTPVLALLNFFEQFVVETDTSNIGARPVLTQNGHPIAYFSKKLGRKLAVASTYVRELYVMTQAIAKW